MALANVRIKRNFRRSFTAALMHDLFNILTVLLIFPVEWLTGMFHERGYGIFTRLAAWLADLIGLEEVARPNSPIKTITAPVVDAANWLGAALMPTTAAAGLMVAGIGLLLMFAALVFMVQNLRGALLRHMDGLFRTYFFRTDARAYGVGVISTVLVQSSSITSSLMVPLAGAGVVRLRRVLPFMMGANLGTTVTSLLAATANPIAAAMTVARATLSSTYRHRDLVAAAGHSVAHCHPWTPTGQHIRYAFLFLIGVFLIVPLVGITLTHSSACAKRGQLRVSPCSNSF